MKTLADVKPGDVVIRRYGAAAATDCLFAVARVTPKLLTTDRGEVFYRESGRAYGSRQQGANVRAPKEGEAEALAARADERRAARERVIRDTESRLTDPAFVAARRLLSATDEELVSRLGPERLALIGRWLDETEKPK